MTTTKTDFCLAQIRYDLLSEPANRTRYDETRDIRLQQKKAEGGDGKMEKLEKAIERFADERKKRREEEEEEEEDAPRKEMRKKPRK
ncbi:hypothetical protein HO133_000124 [Letharia lupina]|uniref:Uncharacterized protein n=1 Tax=Letharia lupina TaxID=560253 RepID=A0A8H6FCE7_9LECA|nr:uncharacterized protein HO133_000124 [Letharia lupina]KAF6223282.1 hypothetical protein HO133_000124 [Letharia lupina]